MRIRAGGGAIVIRPALFWGIGNNRQEAGVNSSVSDDDLNYMFSLINGLLYVPLLFVNNSAICVAPLQGADMWKCLLPGVTRYALHPGLKHCALSGR